MSKSCCKIVSIDQYVSKAHNHSHSDNYQKKQDYSLAMVVYAARESGIQQTTPQFSGGAVQIMPEHSYVSNSAASEDLKSMYKSFINSDLGKNFTAFMEKKGYKQGTDDKWGNKKGAIDDYVVGDMENDSALAAVIVSPGKRVLAANAKHFSSMKDDPVMSTYVLAHEAVHAHGVYSERETDAYLNEFFTEQAKGAGSLEERLFYDSMASYAGQRVESIDNGSYANAA